MIKTLFKKLKEFADSEPDIVALSRGYDEEKGSTVYYFITSNRQDFSNLLKKLLI